VRSAAQTRAAFLVRPDWGRKLDDESKKKLAAIPREKPDLVFVLSDGLSALALHSHALPLLRALKPMLGDLRIAPIVIATQARVALSDEVGQLLGARIAVSLIGERPGLSTPDSLGAYLTAGPRVGRSDAERNCISNIHGAGLIYETAAAQIVALIRTAHGSGISGVGLAKRLAPPSE
jgi:ethanolamine ammonia-lyase small subunit